MRHPKEFELKYLMGHVGYVSSSETQVNIWLRYDCEYIYGWWGISWYWIENNQAWFQITIKRSYQREAITIDCLCWASWKAGQSDYIRIYEHGNTIQEIILIVHI